MPTYDYECPTCGTVFEQMRSINDRHTADCLCGGTAKLVILKAGRIDPNLGVSLDFPTMARKWDKKQFLKGKGLMRDANNDRYGGEYEYKGSARRPTK